MTTAAAFRSDHRPDTARRSTSPPGPSRASPTRATSPRRSPPAASPAVEALDLLDDMLAIRELEEMIVRLRSGGYEPLPGYDYRGPTHVSIGQEAPPSAPAAALRIADNITSSHRGHGDAIAKGFSAIRQMTDDELRARVPWLDRRHDREELLEAALEEHVYRVIAELFGKDEGYCRGRGGGMHIGDFSTGHLGANAIVGGSVPDRHRRRDGPPLRALGPGRLLLRRRRRVRQRRGARVAQLGRPGPVDQPPGRRPRRTGCRSSSSSRTTTTA